MKVPQIKVPLLGKEAVFVTREILKEMGLKVPEQKEGETYDEYYERLAEIASDEYFASMQEDDDEEDDEMSADLEKEMDDEDDYDYDL